MQPKSARWLALLTASAFNQVGQCTSSLVVVMTGPTVTQNLNLLHCQCRMYQNENIIQGMSPLSVQCDSLTGGQPRWQFAL